MPRKRYVTEQDKENERKVAQFLTEQLSVNGRPVFVKLVEDPNGLDYEIYFQDDGSFAGYGELKVRSHEYGTYPTLLLAMSKFKKIQRSQPRGFLFIQYTDEEGFPEVRGMRIKPTQEFYSELGGRTLRTRDESDIELVCFIPIEYLKLIGTMEL